MKHTLVNILFKFRFLEPKVFYSILPSMGSLPWFILLMLFLSSFENFGKPAISLKNLIRYQMRKSLNVPTAESMALGNLHSLVCFTSESSAKQAIRGGFIKGLSLISEYMWFICVY